MEEFIHEEERKARRFAWRIRAIERTLSVVSSTQDAWMLTITLPSKAGGLKDRMQKLRKIVRDAVGRFVAPEGARQSTTVYALEVTLGVDGWHPHLHIGTICDRSEPIAVDCLRCYCRVRGYGRSNVKKVDHLGYLTYLAKTADIATWDEKSRSEYARSTYRVRRFGVMGLLYGDPWINLVASDMRRGVAAAYSIAKAIGGKRDGLPTHY